MKKSTRSKIEEDRANARNRIAKTGLDLVRAEGLATALRIRRRTQPTAENLDRLTFAVAEVKALRHEVRLDAFILATLGLAGEAREWKLEIMRDVLDARARVARAAEEFALTN